MGIWYRIGTASVANGSPTVTGVGTTWLVYVRPGDRITFDGGGKWYEVLAVPSNTTITLATNFAETTISPPGVAYAIDPSSYRHQIPSDILEQVRQAIAGQTDVFITDGAPLASLGGEDSIAFDPVAKVLYVKGPSAWGAPVPFGDIGPQGARGQGGLSYAFDNGTTNADPGSGRLRFNAAPASATAIYVSEIDALGANVAAYLATFDDSTNTALRGTLLVSASDAPQNFRIYGVTGTVTDSGAYNGIVVAHVAGAGAFSNNDALSVQFFRAGDLGATGPTGAPGGDSVLMTFATATADADPGAGLLRLNNAALASVTQAFIDETTPAAVNIAAWLDTLDDSSNAPNKAVVTFSRASSPAANFARYYLTAVVTASGYRKLSLTHIVSAGSLTTGASDTLMSVERIGDAGTPTIANNQVTNLLLADMATATFKGRTSAGTGDPEDLTVAQATALLNAFTTTLKGLVPPPATSDTSRYLRADGTWANPGVRNINAQTGTAYTLALTDAGGLVTMNNAAANTLTVPPNASVAIPINAQIDVSSLGAGQTTIAAGAGVTIVSEDSKLKLSKRYSAGTLVKIATDTWLLAGSLAL